VFTVLFGRGRFCKQKFCLYRNLHTCEVRALVKYADCWHQTFENNRTLLRIISTVTTVEREVSQNRCLPLYQSIISAGRSAALT